MASAGESRLLYSCQPPPTLPLAQELRLGTAPLSHLDLENCGHLREVQLSEGPSRASLDGGSRAAEGSAERRRKVRGRIQGWAVHTSVLLDVGCCLPQTRLACPIITSWLPTPAALCAAGAGAARLHQPARSNQAAAA